MTTEKRYEFKKDLMQIHKPDLKDPKKTPNADDFVFTVIVTVLTFSGSPEVSLSSDNVPFAVGNYYVSRIYGGKRRCFIL